MVGRSVLILVTRPQPQADDWVGYFNTKGLSASALPLLDIAPVTDLAPVHAAWNQLKNLRLLVFVSPNAVLNFANNRPHNATWPSTTLAAAPGPGTEQALKDHFQALGLLPHHIFSVPEKSQQFDSEHLWTVLSGQDWAQQRVLMVKGGVEGKMQGRFWLSQQFEAAGAQVSNLVAYERCAANWSASQLLLAEKAYAQPQAYVWLFSNSQAVEYLVDRMGSPPSHARAIATHPRIAETVFRCGFVDPLVVSPSPENICQAVAQLPRL